MNKSLKSICGVLILITLVFPSLYGQRHTSNDDLLYKKEIIRAIDLREKQNLPLYSYNKEIGALLLEAILNGEITAYKNDSLTRTLTIPEVQQRLSINGSNIYWADTIGMTQEEKTTFIEDNQEYYFEGKDLYQMQLVQEWTINNQTSTKEVVNKSITFLVPADHPDNIRGYELLAFTLDFEDCLEFWNNNPNTFWFNPYNDAEHLAMADAFTLELYSSYIIKISNPENEYISDTYENTNSRVASQNTEFQLMEYESNIWEN